jgi:hypothetical protein
MQAINPSPEPSNSFLTLLQTHRGAGVLADASQGLSELVAAVQNTGKPGTLTVTLRISPASRGNSAVVVGDRIVAKVPQMAAEESFWFATEDGKLLRDDPRQARLPFPRAVPEAQESGKSVVRGAPEEGILGTTRTTHDAPSARAG